MAPTTRRPSFGLPPDNHAIAAIEDLRSVVSGEVRADRLSRALYATDAGIYQIVPDAVVLPKSVDDVVATVRACARHGVPLTARGAGTGLTGGAVNRGIQLDCSRYMTRILDIDPDRRTATVEPGVVLDELNAELAPHGLHFAPDVATGSRATIGGMIANDSCGARSILHGRTADHVLNIDVVLSDGSTCTWGPGAPPPPAVGDAPTAAPISPNAEPAPEDLARRCERVLLDVARDDADEIAARYPSLLRHSGGYALDRLRIDSGRINPEAVVCGSEGTLCIVVGATLKLTPLPRHKGLVVAHFDDLLASLAAVPGILEHRPAAVELVDKLVLDAARANPAAARRCTFIELDPQAILIIELYDDDADALARRLRAVADDLQQRSIGYARPILTDPHAQADAWEVRKSGLGLLMSRPGDRQPYAFVEDTAVDPARLRDYIARFQEILAEQNENVEQAGFYAHAGSGCLHVRPVLNLRRRDDVERMHRIADRVSSLALEFGGTMTGEHGDGIVRSGWLEKMYGPRIIDAFRRIKQAFDPHNLLNPGKIVAPSPALPAASRADALPSGSRLNVLPMTENLRYDPEEPRALALDGAQRGPGSARAGPKSAREPPSTPEEPRALALDGAQRGPRSACAAPEPASQPSPTTLDFTAHGGMAGLAGMCSGVGQCRQRLVGTMCPSYMATGDETHTTRARANALRIALSESNLLRGLDDAALEEVMDLCLSCKACKTECPTGVDLPRLKAEWLHHRHRRRGIPLRSRLIAAMPDLAELGCRAAPLSNWLTQSRSVRAMAQRVIGLDRRMPLPRFARQTFRDRLAQSKEPPAQRAGLSHKAGLCQAGPSAGSAVGGYMPTGRSATPRASSGAPGASSGAFGRGRRSPGDAAVQRKRQVVYFVDTWTNCYTPQVGVAAVKVLEALGCEVIVPPTRCCGRPAISKGLLSKAKQLAETNMAILAPYATAGIPIIGTEPSCILTLADEYPQLVRTADAQRVAAAAVTIESFLAGILRDRPGALRLKPGRPPILYHGHCHQKALVGTADAMAVLSACASGSASEINSGCCGMAGSFGHEAEHYDVARAVGEQRLFPAIRRRGDAEIAVSGFSCRHHIRHHTSSRPRHVIEVVADALA